MNAAHTDTTQDNNTVNTHFGLRCYHWLIIIASFVLTLGAWYVTSEQHEVQKRERFEKYADQVVNQITERMSKYEDALWAGVASIHAQSHGIDYEGWKRYAGSLKLEQAYPGINGIGVIYAYDNEAAAQQRIHAEKQFRPNFKIHPPHDNEARWPIVYVEPQSANMKAVGLDMAHEENRFTAAKKARDTGTAQITGPIVLVQDNQKTPGFLFYAPFYKHDTDLTSLTARQENFIGMVYAPFIFKRLIEGTLAQDNRLIGIAITDGTHVLYDEHTQVSESFDTSPTFSQTRDVEFYGRTWHFEIKTLPSFDHATHTQKPLLLLLSGIIIETLIISLIIVLKRSHGHALRLADKLNKDYKEANISLQDMQNFQTRILDNIPDLVFVKDEELRLINVNKAFLDLYPEDKKDTVLGRTGAEDFTHDEAEAFHAEDRKALREGYTETIETISFPNGQTQTLFTKKIAFENQQGKKFLLGIARNITDLKQTQDALLDSNIELERFAYVAAHDMQEPVRIVKNFADILIQTKSDQLDEEGQLFLKECHKGAVHIQDLIGDLLELSRVSKQSHAFEPLNLHDAYETAINNLSNAINASNALITAPDTMPEIFGNKMCCIRLFQNLISNAIKYQPEGQTPEITITYNSDNATHEFCIQDNGIGIAPEYHAQIFEPFKKLHHHSEYTGTGIGLSICQKIVENMGGKLWIESDIGQGCAFYFTIPTITARGR